MALMKNNTDKYDGKALLLKWRKRDKRKNRVGSIHLHPEDMAHFDKRAEDYCKLQDRLETLDPLKDYTECNIIRRKLEVIIDDFESIIRPYQQEDQEEDF